MAVIDNASLIGGSKYPLIFKDGHIETIPMSSVHIESSGITSLPTNCFPIVASPKTVSHGAAWATDSVAIYFGTSTDRTTVASASAGGTVNWMSGTSAIIYCPACVQSLDNLKSGAFSYSSSSSGNELFYVYAEK